MATAALASSSSGFFCTQRLAFAKHIPLRHVQVQQAHNGQVVCMAHPRRVKMVAQQIKREIGDMLIKDKVIQHAILPETALGADMYLSSLATVSDVVLSNDLQVPLLSLSCRIGLEKQWSLSVCVPLIVFNITELVQRSIPNLARCGWGQVT